MTFASLDFLARVVTDTSAMRIGFDALTVEDGGGGTAAFVGVCAHQSAQTGVERLPYVLPGPLSENMVDGLAWREHPGQKSPLNTAFENIEDGVNDAAAIGWRTTALFEWGQHGLNQSPLGVGERGVEFSDFHRRTESFAWNVKHGFRSTKSTTNPSIFRRKSVQIMCLRFFRQALRNT